MSKMTLKEIAAMWREAATLIDVAEASTSALKMGWDGLKARVEELQAELQRSKALVEELEKGLAHARLRGLIEGLRMSLGTRQSDVELDIAKLEKDLLK